MGAVDDLLNGALATASISRYCRNCKLCYIREEAEHGYCGYKAWEAPAGTPMVVSEWHSCEHWEKKLYTNDYEI